MRILLLGGTTEASQMAGLLAAAGIDATFSYAGRTRAPVSQPLPTRVGGFGGVEGLLRYLEGAAITHVIDATHPFAAGMTRNAHDACTQLGLPLARLERPAWHPGPEDDWTFVPGVEDLPAALPEQPARIFLAIGKQHIGLFATAPHHHYLLRLVDPPEGALPLPDTAIVLARGPFDVAGDRALMETHGITHVVAKNAGGSGARAKLDAARALRLPVILAQRPEVPGGHVLAQPEAVLSWLRHSAPRGV
ncbi:MULTISPECIES: cobalt-precorrin-6A reductase [unclassified Sulfitobacter]|uniref:cobalt-precorrin-6A reductase n=1 Tax=unclassified Sulfitobacter TaxID=196795 RepID=UPI0007C3E6F9|nr:MULTISPECIES: cobalt-precorrin-6A reductase [unclassified Sulfitobacter]KZY05686.1 cobalt-precorrin-6A reductase [Sulfitobacter sp. HI0023]KZY23701.1 cobalt-precorrin-6A reductase [Sulfitobacter sp. HI0040]KZZ67884.1 cobalt-precorrin-6A reductase [Sulfitobacter sp. HI0129]